MTRYLFRTTIRFIAVAAVVAGAAFLATGCGGSDSTSTNAASSSPAASKTSSDPKLPPAPSDTDGADVKGAQQVVLDNLKVPPFAPAGPAFDIKTVDKPVWLVACPSTFETCAQINQGFTEAAKAAGVKYHICPGLGTNQANALCLQQAVDARAGSVVIFSRILADLAQPLKKAKEAGVKVVGGNMAKRLGEPVDPLLQSQVTHDYFGAGRLAGAYAVAAKGSAVNGLCLTILEFRDVTNAVCDGFAQEVAKFCASCEVTVKGVPAAQIPTAVPSTVQAAVLKNPKLNFIQASVDDLYPAAAQQLKRLGKTPDQVMMGGNNATVTALQAMRDHSYMAVDPGQNVFWWGWAFFDAGARAQVNAIQGTQVTQPNALFTREAFKYSGPISYKTIDEMFSFPGGRAYFEDKYKSLWKVK